MSQWLSRITKVVIQFHERQNPLVRAFDAAPFGCTAGMMGNIPNGVREGLLDLFYAVYEKDPDRWALPRLSITAPARKGRGGWLRAIGRLK